MALLSQYYSAPILPGNQPGTFAAGDDPRIVGAAQRIGDDDIEIANPTKGLVLRCENNCRWRMTIDVDGNPTFNPVP